VVLSRLLRAGEHKTVRRLRAIADHINGLEAGVAGLSDAELRAKTGEFRSRHGKGESLDDLLPEAFAVVREAAKRMHPDLAPDDALRPREGDNEKCKK